VDKLKTQPTGAPGNLRGRVAAGLVHAIIEDAEYRGAVGDLEIAQAEASIGLRFPAAWRRYLQRPSRFHRGWRASGAYVWLHTPAESADLVLCWREVPVDRPGMIPFGGDGASEMITIDARDPRPAVMMTPNVSEGWEDSLPQHRFDLGADRSRQPPTGAISIT